MPKKHERLSIFVRFLDKLHGGEQMALIANATEDELATLKSFGLMVTEELQLRARKKVV